MAGSDFIKTSTGKEAVNATLSFGIVMARAIKEYHQKMGYKVRKNVTLFSTGVESKIVCFYHSGWFKTSRRCSKRKRRIGMVGAD